MLWQDVLLMIGGFGFSVALWPAVKAKEKPPILTSAVTGSILASFCVAYATLGLWLAFGSIVINSSMWFVLMTQRLKRRK